MDEEKFLADSANQVKMANSIFEAFNEYKLYYENANQSVVIEKTEPIDYGIPDPVVENAGDANQVVFRVQIVTSKENLSLNDQRFKGITVWEYFSNDLYKYTAGVFTNVEDANKLKNELRAKGFENAFVVAFQGKERITVENAIKLLEK